MIIAIVIIFLLCYVFVALENPLRINKAATALITGVVLWTLYATLAPIDVVQHKLLIQLGETSEILFFLIGAMTIVELIDVNGGFNIITNRISTSNKRKLFWLIGFITFFMSAVLDNLTTAIVMVTLLSKIIPNYKERWVFASIIIIAANAGGAWSPIGDVTTIMLWVRGNVTALSLMGNLILPSLAALLVPLWLASHWLKGDIDPTTQKSLGTSNSQICPPTKKERISILVLGMACLISVPIFKTVTHLPPYMGVLLALGVMWLYTELMYKRNPGNDNDKIEPRIPYVLQRIDMPTLLFFLGILLSVGALQASGVLGSVSAWLDTSIHNAYMTDIVVGILSSVVDNVPLVAGAIATYPVGDAASVAASIDPAYAANFMQDGLFWQFLAYTAGVGGSMLIIGSAAGVVVMGLERMNFVWYLRNISLLAFAGFASGAIVFALQMLVSSLIV
ncbi:MAG: sodium:proton antiporter NhaD [Mucinivorans sp.]